jgi:hypothetical protein
MEEQKSSAPPAPDVRHYSWRELVRAGFWLGVGGMFAYTVAQALYWFAAGWFAGG